MKNGVFKSILIVTSIICIFYINGCDIFDTTIYSTRYVSTISRVEYETEQFFRDKYLILTLSNNEQIKIDEWLQENVDYNLGDSVYYSIRKTGPRIRIRDKYFNEYYTRKGY